jgi:hypothetical protein
MGAHFFANRHTTSQRCPLPLIIRRSPTRRRLFVDPNRCERFGASKKRWRLRTSSMMKGLCGAPVALGASLLAPPASILRFLVGQSSLAALGPPSPSDARTVQRHASSIEAGTAAPAPRKAGERVASSAETAFLSVPRLEGALLSDSTFNRRGVPSAAVSGHFIHSPKFQCFTAFVSNTACTSMPTISLKPSPRPLACSARIPVQRLP